MPRSLRFAEKEQKDQLMCFHVWRGPHLWFQWVVNKSAGATVLPDNAGVIMLTPWVTAWHFERGGAGTIGGCLDFSLKTENVYMRAKVSPGEPAELVS